MQYNMQGFNNASVNTNRCLRHETKRLKGHDDAALHVVFVGSSYILLTISELRREIGHSLSSALILTLVI
jgi:hypothetical protein